MKKFDNYMINRDISWMYFNKRILNEAANTSVPLLERLKFLGIYSSNLDEFFRVRVASLRRIADIEKNLTNGASASKKILKKILLLNESYTEVFEEVFVSIREELKKENIFLIDETQLSEKQAAHILGFYQDELMNSLFPLLVSKMVSEPSLNDQSNYLAIKLSKSNATGKIIRKEFALIEIPTKVFSRFFVLPEEDGKTFIILLDDVIRLCLPLIFSQFNFDRFDAYTIKFTRDAEMEFDDSSNISMPDKVKKGVSSRKSGSTIRFVFDREIQPDLLNFIRKMLKLDKRDAKVSGGRYHNLKDLIAFPGLRRNDLKYPAFNTVPVKGFEESASLIQTIRIKDRFLHFPYHSIDYFIRLLRESAINPDVKEIKITIYRLAKKSKIVQALICAAMNGKKVTAMVELYARFDEESNVNWANKMQEAGIKVIFGVEGLKVHSKLVHITSRSGNIACISTGNFHEGNAALYTDFLLMTANKNIVGEVSKVFDFLKQPYINPLFRHLIVAPIDIRKRLNSLIKTETDNARKGKEAYIYWKVNHIVDAKIIEKLYLASAAGVKIRLLVRGNCSLIPGIQGISDNIRAYGIIDRFLEHSRIMIFSNNGQPKYFLGSADLMQRNLDHRVEAMTPVYDPDLQLQLKKVIEYGLKDNVKARIVDGTDRNLIKPEPGAPAFRSQEELHLSYQKEYRSDHDSHPTQTSN